MGVRGYQKYNIVVTTESQYTWASTDYTLFGLRTDVTIPSGLSTETSVSDTTTGSTTDKEFTKTFIIPGVFDVLTIIDGTISGTIKLAAENDSATVPDTITITKAELTLRAMDSTGSARTISAKQEIWSGSLQTVGGQAIQTLQLMYWAEVEDIQIYANERILIDYTITYTTVDTLATDTFSAYIYCTPDTDETTMTMPFVM